jgi:hypothetical protein
METFNFDKVLKIYSGWEIVTLVVENFSFRNAITMYSNHKSWNLCMDIFSQVTVLFHGNLPKVKFSLLGLLTGNSAVGSI